MAICPSNGYILAFSGYDGSDSKIHIRKFSDCDELLWSKTINPTLNFANVLIDLDVGPNGDIYLLTNHPVGLVGQGNYGLIIHLNSKGETIANKKVSGTLSGRWYYGSSGATNLLIRGNGGIVYSGTGGFIEMDQNYNVLYSEEMVSPNFQENFNGDLIYTGTGGLIKRDQNFQIKWVKSITKQAGNPFIGEFEVIDDGILFPCLEKSTSSNPKDQIRSLIKLDFDGNFVWQSDGLLAFSKPKELKNGNIIVLSYTGDYTVIFHKFDRDGGYLESYEIDVSPPTGSIIPDENVFFYNYVISNRDIILVGSYGDYFNPGNPNLFIARINDDFSNLPCIKKIKLPVHAITPIDIEIGYDYNNQNEVLIENHTIQYSNYNISESILCSEFEGNAKVDTNLCFNSKATLYPSKNFKEYLWSTGSVDDSLQVDSEGTYWMKGYDGCNYYTDSFDVQYTPDPELNYSISNQFASIDEDIEFISLTENIKHLRWNISDGYLTNQERFSYRFLENGLYTVVYSFYDQYNCFYEDSSRIKVKFLQVLMPNSFTPNSDGINDVLEPIGFGIHTYRLQIYDRSGGLIAEQIDQPWTGEDKPMGMYMYNLEITDVFGESEVSQGTFNLIRK